MTYDLSLEEIRKRILKDKPKTVLLQLPAGLRTNIIPLVDFVESLGPSCLVWAGSCYGACDLPNFKADLIIHFGHEEFRK